MAYSNRTVNLIATRATESQSQGVIVNLLLPEIVLSIDQMLFSPLDKALYAPTLPQQGPTFEQQFQSFPYSVSQWHTCTLYPPALSPVTHVPAGSYIVLMMKGSFNTYFTVL